MHITGIFSVFFTACTVPMLGVRPPKNSAELSSMRSAPPFFGLYGVFKTATANLKQYFIFHIYTNFRLFVLSAAL